MPWSHGQGGAGTRSNVGGHGFQMGLSEGPPRSPLINIWEPSHRQAQEEPTLPSPPRFQPWWVSAYVGSGFQLCSPISLATTSPCPSCLGPQNCGIGEFQVPPPG